MVLFVRMIIELMNNWVIYVNSIFMLVFDIRIIEFCIVLIVDDDNVSCIVIFMILSDLC